MYCSSTPLSIGCWTGSDSTMCLLLVCDLCEETPSACLILCNTAASTECVCFCFRNSPCLECYPPLWRVGEQAVCSTEVDSFHLLSPTSSSPLPPLLAPTPLDLTALPLPFSYTGRFFVTCCDSLPPAIATALWIRICLCPLTSCWLPATQDRSSLVLSLVAAVSLPYATRNSEHPCSSLRSHPSAATLSHDRHQRSGRQQCLAPARAQDTFAFRAYLCLVLRSLIFRF